MTAGERAANRPLDLWIAEQVEAVAIAIAMALVLKFFVIEAYQIPTGSMQPTILGDAETGIKDRVLADKLCTMIRDPRRWEVMIFRFPNDERRLYVKRILGLPGEHLEVMGGDIWVDGAIARKPDKVNDSVLKAVYPAEGGGMDIGRAFTAGPGVTVTGRSATFAPDTDSELRLRHTVRAEYLHGYDPDWGFDKNRNSHRSGPEAVSDLELSATVELADGAEELLITLMSDEGDLVFRLTPSGGDDEVDAKVTFIDRAGDSRVLAEHRPADGGRLDTDEAVEIVARDIDRQIVLWVDGDEWLRVADDLSGARVERPTRALASLAIRGGGEVEDLVVSRDIFYEPKISLPAWDIPEDSYFAMGDNTQGSLDSRNWETMTYTLEDGRVITGFFFPKPPVGPAPPDHNPRTAPDGGITFADLHGDEYTFSRSEIVDQTKGFAPFIHRRYLLGKAVAVFWPIYNPFRWKLIR
jgi:signal peptidase I